MVVVKEIHQVIIESLSQKIKTNLKALIGNKGYRKYLKMGRDSVRIDQDKIEATIKDGVLRLHLPKAESAKSKKIAVKTG